VQPKTSKQDHGILDNIRSVASNLGSDVVDTVEGIPGGIVETIHHPIKTAEAIGHDYRNRYGPLFGYVTGEGDIGKFAASIKEHPLAPILDVATVATLGGGAAAKIGQGARIASKVEAGTAGKLATGLHKATSGGYREIAVTKSGGKGVKIPLHNNPVKRLRRNMGISFQEKVMPINTPIIGLKSRAVKAAANEKLERTGAAGQTRHVQRQMIAAVDAMEKVAGGDTKRLDSMANAADYLVSGVDPLKHAETIKKTRLDPKHQEKLREAGHTEDEIQAAMDHALRPALDADAKRLFDAAQAHYQRKAIAEGHDIPEHLLVKANKADIDSPEVQAIVKVRDAHDRAATDAMTQMVKPGKLTPDEISQRRVLHVTTVELLNRMTTPAVRAVAEKVETPVKSLSDEDWAASLSGKQQVALADHSAGNWVNDHLYGRSVEKINKDRAPETLAAIDSAFENAPRSLEEMVLHRGVGLPSGLHNAKPGDVVPSKGYVSTSLSESASRRYGDIRMEIHVPAGTPHLPLHKTRMKQGREMEILLQRGGSFKVRSIEQTGKANPSLLMKDRYKMVVDYIPPTKAAKAEKAAPEPTALESADTVKARIKQDYDRQAKQFRRPQDKARLDALRKKRDADLARVDDERRPLSAEEIDKAYDLAGLPRPVYNPDTLSVGSSSKAGKFGDSGDYASGDRIVSPMEVIMRHEWASKITDAQHAHALLTSLATKFDGELPNTDWVWVRDNMPKTAEYSRDLGKSQQEAGIATSKEFYAQLRDEVKPKSGLAVPRQIFDEMTVGRAAMTAGRHKALAKALNIWKWATLATRPGFLTVNVLSNQLMYHLKNGCDFRAFRNAKVAAGAFDEHHAVAGATWGDTERGLSQG